MQTMLSDHAGMAVTIETSVAQMYVKNYFYFDVNKVNFRALVEMYVAWHIKMAKLTIGTYFYLLHYLHFEHESSGYAAMKKPFI